MTRVTPPFSLSANLSLVALFTRICCLVLFNPREEKALSERNREKTKTFEMEFLEKQILGLKGEKREEAMGAYRRIPLSLGNEPIYFVGS